MTELSPQPEQLASALMDKLRRLATEVRIGLGRVAASGLFVAASTVATLSAHEAVSPAPAMAYDITTGDYPDATAPCYPPSVVHDTHGNYLRCNNYDWRVLQKDSSGNITAWPAWTDRGYGARNCTDYIAWRVKEEFGKNIPGLENATKWDNNASSDGLTVRPAGQTPEIGDIAQFEGDDNDQYSVPGHVAFVTAVHLNADGSLQSVDVDEYNHDTKGNFGHRTNVTGISHYIDVNGTNPANFKLKLGDTGPPFTSAANDVTAMSSQHTPDGNQHIYWVTKDGILRETWFNAQQGVFTNTIKRFGKMVTALSSQYSARDGLQHVYAGTTDGEINEFWFGPNTGGYTGRIITNIGSAVTAMSSQYTADGTQHIYYATADRRIEETWFNPQQGDHTYIRSNESSSPIEALTTQVTSDGTVHIYWGNDEGQLHERYITAGSTGLNVMAHFPHPITALSSQTTPDGKEHVYSATTDGTIRETWFDPNRPGSGYNSWEASHIGTKVNVLSSQYTNADGTTHIFSGADNGSISETWFRPGAVNGWQAPISPAPGAITAISSQYTSADGVEHVFWGAPDGYARETWFRPGTVNTWQLPASH